MTQLDLLAVFDLSPVEAREAEGADGKSEEAFRTITEVAEQLDVPQYVLRFWESKFPQIHPVKGRGGRRYYRPEDVALLGSIKHLLYERGYTIKGALQFLTLGASSEPLAEADLAHQAPWGREQQAMLEQLRDRLNALRERLYAIPA